MGRLAIYSAYQDANAIKQGSNKGGTGDFLYWLACEDLDGSVPFPQPIADPTTVDEVACLQGTFGVIAPGGFAKIPICNGKLEYEGQGDGKSGIMKATYTFEIPNYSKEQLFLLKCFYKARGVAAIPNRDCATEGYDILGECAKFATVSQLTATTGTDNGSEVPLLTGTIEFYGDVCRYEGTLPQPA